MKPANNGSQFTIQRHIVLDVVELLDGGIGQYGVGKYGVTFLNSGHYGVGQYGFIVDYKPYVCTYVL